VSHRLLDEFKGYLNYDLGDVTKDDSISLCLSASEKFLQSYYGVHCESASYTYVTDGNALDYLYLPHVISSVTSDSIDAVAVDSTLISPKGNKLRLKEGSFTSGFDNVSVVYNVGYSDLDLPMDLKVAMFKLASKLFKDSDENRDAISGYNTNTKTGIDFIQKHLPDTFELLIAPYRVIYL